VGVRHRGVQRRRAAQDGGAGEQLAAGQLGHIDDYVTAKLCSQWRFVRVSARQTLRPG
jgi:hypothetical protein